MLISNPKCQDVVCGETGEGPVLSLRKKNVFIRTGLLLVLCQGIAQLLLMFILDLRDCPFWCP